MEAEERVGWIVVLAIILCAAVTAVRHAREAGVEEGRRMSVQHTSLVRRCRYVIVVEPNGRGTE